MSSSPFNPGQKMLSVLVIDESQRRAIEICSGLVAAGYQVAALVPDTLDLSDQVQRLRPDVVLIETESHAPAPGNGKPKPNQA